MPPGIRYERACPSLPGFGKLGRRRQLDRIWNLEFGIWKVGDNEEQDGEAWGWMFLGDVGVVHIMKEEEADIEADCS